MVAADNFNKGPLGAPAIAEHLLSLDNERPPVQRFVVCAAIRYRIGAQSPFHVDHIICGARHYDATMVRVIQALALDRAGLPPSTQIDQGFIDQFGVFMDRREALSIATFAGQINTRRPKNAPYDQLFSEDLY